jgi:hypothetical protein
MKLSLLNLLLSSASLAIAAQDVTAVQGRDLCLGISYTDAVTNQASCCNELLNVLYWVDITKNLGICCPLGQVLQGLLCVPPPPPPAAGICSGKGVCPHASGTDLGIQYSHCYVLKSINGGWLGHDSDVKYIVNGENPAVIFRICNNPPDCVTAANEYVPVNGTWYMQDQMGSHTSTGWGWIGGTGDLTIQNDPSTALVVGGSSSCWDGQCAVCITFPPGGAAAPCPLNPGQSHLGVSGNPNNCQAFYFQEVPCRSEL